MKGVIDITTASQPRRFWLRVKSEAINVIGWCLERFKAPAKLKAFEFVDPATDETVYLYTTANA